MTLGLQGLKMAARLAGSSNPNAASDLGVAALCLNTCVQGAWFNVRINLPGIKNDAEQREFQVKGSAMRDEAERICAEISLAVQALM